MDGYFFFFLKDILSKFTTKLELSNSSELTKINQFLKVTLVNRDKFVIPSSEVYFEKARISIPDFFLSSLLFTMAPFPTKLESTLKGHKGTINSACYNHSGQYCVSGGRDRSVRLWNPTSELLLYTYNGHSRDVLTVTA